MTSEGECAFVAIDAEHRNVIRSLVAHIKELACGIEIEAARIIPTRPFVRDEGQFTVLADCEYSNAVMQSVARVDEAAIGRNEYL